MKSFKLIAGEVLTDPLPLGFALRLFAIVAIVFVGTSIPSRGAELGCGAAEARARAALAIAAAPADLPRAAAAVGCECHDTGKCACDPKSCKCCGELPPYADQREKALKLGVPFVVFIGHGVKGSCFDGAVSAWASSLPGFPPKCVVVSYPLGGRVLESEQLAPGAGREDLAAAITRAAAKSKTPPALMPATIETVPPTWLRFPSGGCPGGVCPSGGCPGGRCPYPR